ncbi:ABC transporter ATP-binding protein [Paenibacillus sp. LS1]|uniref:ABC transporter ATP-binding protein n=1 Tax=Paenibacillus sp. LS1 TaxID=2992120 RepID=UPI00222FA20A|nr:ABC transporter ATP-binding protein [Paenibacillus sp. LS1]MCW3791571.1 ABC transporter ATP-binding protein [Paenibacillus sp. LS1]
MFEEHHVRLAAPEPLLALDNVCADVIEDGISQRLLHDVSFSIYSGRVVGIAGQSGSGKTLTCRSILQLLDPAIRVNGSIRLRGNELNGMAEEQLRTIRGNDIGYIVQNPMNALVSVHSIGSQFVETIRTHTRCSKKDALTLAVQALESVRLPDPPELLKRYPFELSGGMLQRVLIALTMCLSPSIVIADEPTTALDTINQYHVLEELERLRMNQDVAILLITHDLDVIAEMADEVIVMHEGRVVEHNDVLSIFNRPQHAYTQELLHSRLNE